MTNPEMALAAAEAEIVAWEKLPPARQIKIRTIRRRALAFLREVEILGLVADEKAIETLKRLANAPIGGACRER
ncbi:hypothetical protein ACVWZ3_003830 [Bradyrhizobium sp. i1.3.6]